jgi:hypothetical protein
MFVVSNDISNDTCSLEMGCITEGRVTLNNDKGEREKKKRKISFKSPSLLPSR